MVIIVPVDFSVTSQNANLYALQMLKGRYEATLVLYHVYYLPEDRERTELTLEAMKQKLSNLGNVTIVCCTEHSRDFTDVLSRKARQNVLQPLLWASMSVQNWNRLLLAVIP